MKKKKEVEVKNKKYRNFTLILGLCLIFFLMVAYTQYYSISIYGDVEYFESENELSMDFDTAVFNEIPFGYEEECFEEITEEKHRFIEEGWRHIMFCENKCKNEDTCMEIYSRDFCYYSIDRCYDYCRIDQIWAEFNITGNEFVPSHVEYYNETRCTKSIMVRHDE